MQNRYVGDAGDYAKYALLRSLCAGPLPLSLGVLWYLFPDEGHNGDGRHVAYLRQRDLSNRDAGLHATLAQLVESGQRSVAAVEAAGILPGARFHASPVAIAGAPAQRAAHRANWFGEALTNLAGTDLLFFDPDNGVETRSLNRSDYRAGKFAFWSEIEAAWATGASLVLYNHLNRTAPAAVQTERLRVAFRERLTNIGLLAPLLFRRGSCRHLWTIAQPRHAARLRDRIGTFLNQGWAADTDCDIST